MQMTKYIQISLIPCLLICLSGCGQTGSLYLPEPDKKNQTPSPSSEVDKKATTKNKQDK